MRDQISPKVLLTGRLVRTKSDPSAPTDIRGVYTYRGDRLLNIIASNGEPDYEWDHVSVSVVGSLTSETPTWSEMCEVKGIFFRDDEAVVQFHPPKADNINLAEVLHLWRPWGENVDMPPQIMV